MSQYVLRHLRSVIVFFFVFFGFPNCASESDPVVLTAELCNGIDDNHNGITDTDRWPELHTCCAGSSVTSTFMGTWECDLEHVGIICAGNFEETTPAACE